MHNNTMHAERPDLLIIDGFGFDRIEREQSPQGLSLLYKVIDRRGSRRSTALITNIDFDAWNEYLDDGPLVMALLDRLFEKAIIKRFLKAMNGTRQLLAIDSFINLLLGSLLVFFPIRGATTRVSAVILLGRSHRGS